ncbi:MAG: hypothetical protein ABJF10_05585, partial [Chthoniobacter sp.]|uniref:hypothetical protein n=1 Tax=Chthoniobacter sp. TaxID=2510640 RepID=UPI0032A88C06
MNPTRNREIARFPEAFRNALSLPLATPTSAPGRSAVATAGSVTKQRKEANLRCLNPDISRFEILASAA